SNHFNIALQNYSGKVDLVLCCDKADKVTKNEDGTATWQVRNDLSYTFKSIKFKHSYVDGKCTTATDNGDGTHSFECSVCRNTAAEDHTLTYSASGNVITASCSANCGYGGTATISATGKTYDGNAVTASVNYSEGWPGSNDLTITYAVKDSTVLNGAPKDAGTYTASITTGSAIASVDFTISPAALSISNATVADKVYDGTTAATASGIEFSGFQSSDTLIAGTDYTVTAAFADANAGYDKPVTVTVTLQNTTAANNYTLSSAAYTTAASITRATVAADLTAASGLLYKAGTNTIVLPSMPENTGHGTPIFSAPITSAEVSAGSLVVTGSAEVVDGSTYTVSIPVNSEGNYENYTVTVTLTGKELPRPSYGGGGYIPTTPSVSDKVEITVPDTLGDDVNVEAETITTSTLNDVKDIASDDDKLSVIGGKDSAVQIKATEDNKAVESFTQPVTVTVPVSKSALKNVEDVNKLTLALVTEDETGNTKLTYVGGSYDAENGTFSAYTNMPGNYVLVEKADLMEIVLTIDSTIAHVNDKSVAKDVPSRIVGSRTLVPAAFVLHHMGCGVEWIGDTRTVVVTLPNGEKLFMPVDTPIPGFGTQPIIENGRTLVPVAYVAAMMDAYVLWVGDERKVIIVK
ncbi:MAG: hypothetical protein IJD56_01425, partial [Peptococcaceae bacterium]|nr:hypothetical protein [Peptococcaceae bacterium]